MTISGSVTSSQSISLTKASSILKTFIATETGASQASAAFLRRSSASFIELVQFHRNLRAGKPEKKQKVTALEDHVVENGEGSGRKKKNKRDEIKKRKKEEDGSKSLEDSEERHSRKKKRRKHEDAQ